MPLTSLACPGNDGNHNLGLSDSYFLQSVGSLSATPGSILVGNFLIFHTHGFGPHCNGRMANCLGGILGSGKKES